MQPRFFKKDSRTWLHKNSHAKINPPPHLHECPDENSAPEQIFGQVPHNETLSSLYPLLSDANGKVFKKDSRTWLHKNKQATDHTKQFAADQHCRRLTTTLSTTEILRSNFNRRQHQEPMDADFDDDDPKSIHDVRPLAAIPKLNSDSHLDLSSMTKRHDTNRLVSGQNAIEKMARLCSIDLQHDDIDEECDEENCDEADEDTGANIDTDRNSDTKYDYRGGSNKWLRNKDEKGMDYISKTTLEMTENGLTDLDDVFKENEPSFVTARRYRRLNDKDLSPEVGQLAELEPVSLEREDNESLLGVPEMQSHKSDYQLSLATEHLHVRSPCQHPLFDPSHL